MYEVYVLKDSRGRVYKGMTNDLKRRLQEHRSHGTVTTSKMVGLKLVYSEKFGSFALARQRELYFKTAAGRRFLKKII